MKNQNKSHPGKAGRKATPEPVFLKRFRATKEEQELFAALLPGDAREDFTQIMQALEKEPARSVMFEITHPEKPQTLRVRMVAANDICFDVSWAGRDYHEVIQDVCRVAPFMMRYDSDLQEAYDDAFRTQPKTTDKVEILQFIKKYKGALSELDLDLWE